MKPNATIGSHSTIRCKRLDTLPDRGLQIFFASLI